MKTRFGPINNVEKKTTHIKWKSENMSLRHINKTKMHINSQFLDVLNKFAINSVTPINDSLLQHKPEQHLKYLAPFFWFFAIVLFTRYLPLCLQCLTEKKGKHVEPHVEWKPAKRKHNHIIVAVNLLRLSWNEGTRKKNLINYRKR